MIKVFILILIVGADNKYQNASSVTTVQQEFSSIELCQSAMKSINSQMNNTSGLRVQSSGCYEK